MQDLVEYSRPLHQGPANDLLQHHLRVPSTTILACYCSNLVVKSTSMRMHQCSVLWERWTSWMASFLWMSIRTCMAVPICLGPLYRPNYITRSNRSDFNGSKTNGVLEACGVESLVLTRVSIYLSDCWSSKSRFTLAFDSEICAQSWFPG